MAGAQLVLRIRRVDRDVPALVVTAFIGVEAVGAARREGLLAALPRLADDSGVGLADLVPADVVDALHAAGIPVDLARARSWIISDREDSFFPISIAEMERNLRALLALREAERENLAALLPAVETSDLAELG
jgi:hypothetical protein